MTTIDPPGTHAHVDAASSPSPFVHGVQPITAGDDEIRAALRDAEIPPLLPALAYLTGDLALLRDEFRPEPLMAALPQGGLTEEQQHGVRELALAAIVAFRDGGSVPAPAPSDTDLLRILEFTVGGGEMVDYLPLLEEELAYRGEDRRAPSWQLTELAPDRSFEVVIIGAGMSGLLAAHRLQQAGVSYVVVDKAAEVGGTWSANTYPGCRVDNPNHNYSYSFAQRHDWPFHFSNQPVLRDYFRDCAEAFGVREHLRLETDVLGATWSDETAQWTVTVRDREGVVSELRADAVVSAVGQLSRPRLPDIAGRETFAGPAFHSAEWDDTVELRGRRIAVIGTGASAVQFIPEIAGDVGELNVFQRTPPWLAPTPDYHEPIPAGLRWLYGHLPSYSELNRFAIFWHMGDGAIANVRVEEDFEPKGAAVGAANDFIRLMLTDYLTTEFADRPDLLEHVIPTYPPGAKRMLRDNGVWARTLKQDNVRLVTEPITAITPTGIMLANGDHLEVDVVIYGSGFEASQFLAPMKVVGRGGVDLHEQWRGDARAYLGVTVPGFPNFFCLYGPNTNIVINGSIIYFSECGVRYLLGCIELLLARGARSIEIRRDVHDEFNEQVDAENKLMAWGWSDVSSWYKNDLGRVAQNWPFTLLEYWRRTLRPEPSEYSLGT